MPTGAPILTLGLTRKGWPGLRAGMGSCSSRYAVHIHNAPHPMPVWALQPCLLNRKGESEDQHCFMARLCEVSKPLSTGIVKRYPGHLDVTVFPRSTPYLTADVLPCWGGGGGG